MKLVLRGGMLAFGMIVVYSIPLVIMPWSNESLTRWLAVLNILQATTSIGVFWLLYEFVKYVASDVEVPQKNITTFEMRKKNVSTQ